MKRTLLIPLAAMILGVPVLAQQVDEQTELRAKYEKKLAKEFVTYGNWILDYDAAHTKAKAEGKLLFTYFTRSYSP
ncbi:MAG: hypothetical protein ACJAZ8_000614 [Planctomycetota bacterium]|jgi:hypothetical protein